MLEFLRFIISMCFVKIQSAATQSPIKSRGGVCVCVSHSLHLPSFKPYRQKRKINSSKQWLFDPGAPTRVYVFVSAAMDICLCTLLHVDISVCVSFYTGKWKSKLTPVSVPCIVSTDCFFHCSHCSIWFPLTQTLSTAAWCGKKKKYTVK